MVFKARQGSSHSINAFMCHASFLEASNIGFAVPKMSTDPKRFDGYHQLELEDVPFVRIFIE